MIIILKTYSAVLRVLIPRGHYVHIIRDYLSKMSLCWYFVTVRTVIHAILSQYESLSRYLVKIIQIKQHFFLDARTLFARHSLGHRHLSDKVVYRAGEVGVSVLLMEDVLQPRPISGLVPHGPLVGDVAVRVSSALQKNCAGFIGCVPGGIVSQGGLFSDGLYWSSGQRENKNSNHHGVTQLSENVILTIN